MNKEKTIVNRNVIKEKAKLTDATKMYLTHSINNKEEKQLVLSSTPSNTAISVSLDELIEFLLEYKDQLCIEIIKKNKKEIFVV